MNVLRDESGAAGIEAALALPFYFALIFATIEFGHIYWQYNSIQWVADALSRCTVVNNCSTNTMLYNEAANVWSSSSAADKEIHIYYDADCGSYSGTRVTIIHQIASLTGYFREAMPPSFSITVQSCYPKTPY